MRNNPEEPFYLIVQDRENAVFNILGPMTDAANLHEKTD